MADLYLNCGSGQRRFAPPFCNIDVVSRPPDQVPDLIADLRHLPYPDGCAQMVVLHHVLEHFHLGPEMEQVVRECHRVLAPGGSLLVFTPDIRKLAVRWLTGQLDDFGYTVQLYGAWQGHDGDDHHWNWSVDGLVKYLEGYQWWQVKRFDWRDVPGSDFARDWYIAAVECVK